MDLGARPVADLLPGHAARDRARRCWRPALLVFALSIDDYVITSFVAGVGATTLPLQIYSMVRSGISPEINAVSTVLLVATALLLFAAWRLEQGGRARRGGGPGRRSASPSSARPSCSSGAPRAAGRVLNVFIWSGYLPPETVKTFEARHGVRVNVDLYDSLEALLAKMQAGNAGYDVVCPSNYAVRDPARAEAAAARSTTRRLPHLANVDPRLPRPRLRPRQPAHRALLRRDLRHRATGRAGSATVDSWAALWDPRFKGRILMLDDARETFGAALRRLGRSVNTTDERRAARGAAPARRAEAARARLRLRELQGRAARGGRVAGPGLERRVRAGDGRSTPTSPTWCPKEGSTALHRQPRHPEGRASPGAGPRLPRLRDGGQRSRRRSAATMRYTTPQPRGPRAAAAARSATTRPSSRPRRPRARVELLRDLGPATVLYDRLWTEVKTAR